MILIGSYILQFSDVSLNFSPCQSVIACGQGDKMSQRQLRIISNPNRAAGDLGRTPVAYTTWWRTSRQREQHEQSCEWCSTAC